MAYKYFVGQIASDYNALEPGIGSYVNSVTSVGDTIKTVQRSYIEAFEGFSNSFAGDILAGSTNSTIMMVDSLNGALTGINTLSMLITEVEAYYKLLVDIKTKDEQDQEYIRAAGEWKRVGDKASSNFYNTINRMSSLVLNTKEWIELQEQANGYAHAENNARKKQREFEDKIKAIEIELDELVSSATSKRNEIIGQDAGFSFNSGADGTATSGAETVGVPDGTDLSGLYDALVYAAQMQMDMGQFEGVTEIQAIQQMVDDLRNLDEGSKEYNELWERIKNKINESEALQQPTSGNDGVREIIQGLNGNPSNLETAEVKIPDNTEDIVLPDVFEPLVIPDGTEADLTTDIAQPSSVASLLASESFGQSTTYSYGVLEAPAHYDEARKVEYMEKMKNTHPELQEKVYKMIKDAKEKYGIDIKLSSGYRDEAKANELYRNRGSNPNPVAKPGTSMHDYGYAADIGIAGKTQSQVTKEEWAIIGKLAEENDLIWGGNWGGKYDPVHVELKDAKAKAVNEDPWQV